MSATLRQDQVGAASRNGCLQTAETNRAPQAHRYLARLPRERSISAVWRQSLQLAIVSLSLALAGCDHTPKSSAKGSTLTVFCAAGLKQPVEAIAAKYREELGVEVQLQYGGTGTLLSQIRVAQRGDLFIAADDAGVTDARKFDAIREVIPMVKQRPVIAVRAGNPKKIATLADLARDDVKLALANPEAAAIGRSVRTALGEK